MVVFNKVTKKFNNGTLALSDIDLEIADDEFVYLVGPSGAGKSTLLRLLIRELLPTSGELFLNDLNIVKLSSSKTPRLRRKIGIVFQDMRLLGNRNVFENIALALEINNKSRREIDRRVSEVLEIVGLNDYEKLFPLQLSGGELQRVAIARAIAAEPEIVLADEPTGNLDPATSWKIIELLEKINERGTTILMATHNFDIVNSTKKRVVKLDGGIKISDEKSGKYS